MNGKNVLVGTSIVSILIFSCVLFFLVFKIYTQETEKFDYRYREIVDKSIEWMVNSGKGNGFSKSTYILDGVSLSFIDFLNRNQIVDSLELRETIYAQLTKILISYQEVDSNLLSFLKLKGYDEPFRSYFTIRQLNLIDLDKIIPIHTPGFTLDSSRHSFPAKNAILVYQYQFVGNHFNMTVDYFIDFSNKKKEVLREIALSAFLALLSLVVVVVLFLRTLHNLLVEKKLSQMKTDFINNMTHELKTPLSTISVASKSLENNEILHNPQRVLETAKVISRQNGQLAKQINHLLEISRWERGQFESNPKTVDIVKLVSGIVESFRWECKDADVAIEENYRIGFFKIDVDETMITSAILNILSNAVKYNRNRPKIEVNIWSSNNSLSIAVADNGIGIEKGEISRIFEKFYRVSTGNIHTVKGLGLGLFYVQQIVLAHHGTIRVVSKPGIGSTFTIILPANAKS
ncbi:MAG: sensor histidine kinase [Bacteroidales bacterium]